MSRNCKIHRKQPYNCPLCDQAAKAIIEQALLPRR